MEQGPLEKLILTQLVKKLAVFKEIGRSLPCSQKYAIAP